MRPRRPWRAGRSSPGVPVGSPNRCSIAPGRRARHAAESCVRRHCARGRQDRPFVQTFWSTFDHEDPRVPGQGTPAPASACRCRAAIPPSRVHEATEAAQKLGGPVWVVKAQIHAGGRGKGGGVKLARSLDEVKTLAGQILGMQLEDAPDRPAGPEGAPPADRGRRRHQEGVLRRRAHRPRDAEGRDDGLERRRHGHRGGGARHAREDHQGLRRSARRPDRRAGAASSRAASACPRPRRRRRSTCSRSSTRCYMETDASLAEINPLILEGNGNIKALDAKFNFDSQRAVPPPRDRRLPRPRRRGPGRDRGQQVRPRLHPARRQHRLPRQRRRPGDGDDGHDQAVRRRAGQLPRRRRRRHGREGHRGVQDHAEATRR